MNRSLKMLVVSDLHAYTNTPEEGDPPSWLQVSSRETPANSHPVAGLRQLLEERGLEADLLLCCGDMTDKADPQALLYAWDQLHSLADTCSAQLIATAGNHDLDSRFVENRFDPKAELQKLDPVFPFDDPEAADRYWARNYAIFRGDGYRIVTLNSCAYHGYRREEDRENEHEHGRVSEDTIDRLMAELGRDDNQQRPHSILMCHHHPVSIDPDDPSEMMVDGHLLIEALQTEGPWLIVHGHKHIPHLRYAAGGGDAPIIFSAGSMSAWLWQEATHKTRNQVYLITLAGSDDLPNVPGASLAGTFQSFEWTDQVGWQDATPGAGLPSAGGFGYRGSPTELAKRIQAFVEATDKALRWDAVVTQFPEIPYVLPSDFRSLITALSEGPLALTLEEARGRPVEVGPRT